MKVLFDSSPISRFGVEVGTNEVVLAQDFSCMVFMMEEYLALGITEISIPSSHPQAKLISSMPRILAEKVEVVNDYNEILAAGRLLHHCRAEIGATYDEADGRIGFKKETPREIRELVVECHGIVRRLAYGFNRQANVELLSSRSLCKLTELRQTITDPNERIAIAQLEGVLSKTKDYTFDAVKPQSDLPMALLGSLDKLINDPSYISYSRAVSHLGPGERGQAAMTDVRHYGRVIKESKIAELLWSTMVVAVSVLGVQVPSFVDAGRLLPERRFPLLLDMKAARQRAIANWVSNCKDSAPLNLSSSNREIVWLRPSPSIEASVAGSPHTSMGKVGDLLAILKEHDDLLEKTQGAAGDRL
ncbi:hypothetical protein [Sinorhizobium medicae]|uniref:hypothetical protein n=1 Tax=Sinorhizobium medicae TaxID=110321 RepID=UPI000FD93F85|nr:hypothetical protein [Sinorhizobium medicae]MDX1003191.1 hypothetical protein [Sinorhizobium medicae]RVO82349.1 hypothetical protein CN084_03240 [Sinorhizobium medicae]